MRSIKRKFDNITEKNPYWSSYLCFAETVKDKNFSYRIIKKYFNQLVDKEDYSIKEKREIINYLYQLSASKEK
jgi:hypothetical protein